MTSDERVSCRRWTPCLIIVAGSFLCASLLSCTSDQAAESAGGRTLCATSTNHSAPNTVGNLASDGGTNTYADKYFYAGIPKATSALPHPLLVLTNIGYVVGYDDARKDPVWVCYRLFKVSNVTPPPRPKQFVVDSRTTARVASKDYTGSGYDRGHCAPNRAIGICYKEQAQLETFLMSNIHPQKGPLNQRIWERLEEKEIIDYAQRLQEIWVITGGVYGEHPGKLASGVEIPDACYKILVDVENQKPRVLAFVMPQTVKGDEAFEPFLVSVDDIEKKTGLDFMSELPDELEDVIEAGKIERMW